VEKNLGKGDESQACMVCRCFVKIPLFKNILYYSKRYLPFPWEAGYIHLGMKAVA
jgi:hypothetical protein